MAKRWWLIGLGAASAATLVIAAGAGTPHAIPRAPVHRTAAHGGSRRVQLFAPMRVVEQTWQSDRVFGRRTRYCASLARRPQPNDLCVYRTRAVIVVAQFLRPRIGEDNGLLVRDAWHLGVQSVHA